MSAGVVIPGVSSTVLLMLLGSYETYLNAISIVNLSILIPMAIGLILGGYIFLKLIHFLIEHFFSQTYYTIIGFVLGSLVVIYPGISFNFTGLISIVSLIFSFLIGKNLKASK